MEEQDIKAEDKILQAASEIFIQKGLSGARMQEIADKAGINKALLHYYYRTKDNLFESVFSMVLKKLIVPEVLKILQTEPDVFEIIKKFCLIYIEALNKNPFIPVFVLETLQKNQGRMPAIFAKAGLPIKEVLKTFEDAMDNGLIRRMDPKQLVINLISMCIFPIAGQHLIRPILFNDSKRDYKAFIEARKIEVPDFIIHSIKINNHEPQK